MTPGPHRRSSLCAGNESILLVAQNVRRASRCVPGATCLTQALSAQLLLARVGMASTLHIGVATGSAGRGIRAHAWLNCLGTTVTGGEMVSEFVELPIGSGSSRLF